MTIGERVAVARAESGLKQAQLAAAVGMDRSALAKIETGVRRVSAVELVAIARELRRRVEWFVQPGPASIVSYRATRTDLATQPIDAELERIVRDVEFVAERTPTLVGNQPDTAQRPGTPADADALAATARTLLGLDPDQPAHDLSKLVARVGLLPFSVRLGDGADAGTVLLDRGGVAIVNGDMRVGRRRLALAHEFGHYLIADSYATDWRVATADAEALEARLDRFARSLLLPADDLRAWWRRQNETPDETLRDAAVRTGSHYRVDMATLARRLDELHMISGDEAEAVRQVRTKKSDIVEKNLIVQDELDPISLPRSYEQAVLKLYRSEIVSADRALGLLLGTFDVDALPDLPPVSESEIWAVTS